MSITMKTKIDYDLNIFIPEQLDSDDESFWDPANWHIHVYRVDNNTHHEVAPAKRLTQEEILSLGLNTDSYFKDEADTWYGMEGFLFDYWTKMPDSLKLYLESFPKFD